MVEAHSAADELRLRIGVRTRMDGMEEKVEKETSQPSLRDVA